MEFSNHVGAASGAYFINPNINIMDVKIHFTHNAIWSTILDSQYKFKNRI